MYLDRREESMLEGEMGEAVEKAMGLLVKLGDSCDAKDMVEVHSCHLVSCIYNVVYEAGLEIAEKLLAMGANFAEPTTLCTASIPQVNAESFGFPEDWVAKQRRLADLYRAMGAIDDWTCIPYWNVNVPVFGENLAWGESNCVVYANSVIGAKSNRYSSYIDLCAAVAGRVPRLGLHLAENRKGQMLVKTKGLDFDHMVEKDYGLMGYALGLKAVNKVPVIEGVPRGISKKNLRVMGSAAASSGAIALYHIVGVTPEAPNLEKAFQGDKPEDKVEIGLEELKRAHEELSKAGENRVDLVFLGCPHYSIDHIAKVVQALRGRKIHEDVELWVATDTVTAYLAEKMGYAEAIKKAGGKFMVGSCAMNAPTFFKGFKTISTDSAKTAHYAPMNAKTEVYYASAKDCLELSVRGKVS